jgi:hypothetical protein
MEVRNVIKHPTCLLQSDCQYQGSDSFCVHPFSADNITRLIRIAHSQGPVILFVGSINEISRTSNEEFSKSLYSKIEFFFFSYYSILSS